MGVLVVAELFVALCITLWSLAQEKTFSETLSRVFVGVLVTAIAVFIPMVFLYPAQDKYPVVSDTTILLTDSDFVDVPEYIVKGNGDITLHLHKALKSDVKFDHIYFADGPAHIRVVVRHISTSFLFMPETSTTTDLYLPSIYRSEKN